MLYHLFKWFESMGWDIPGANLMNYISFRGAACIILALIIAFWIGPKIIRRLQAKQIGETIRDLGLEGQLAKKGTPTMGGLIILLSILIPVLLFCNLTSVYVLLLIFTTLCLGLIGFKDDSIKVFKKNKEGLKEKYKIFGQLAVGIVVGVTLLVSKQNVIRLYSDTPHEGEQKEVVRGVGDQKVIYYRDVKSRTTTIPFLKHNEFKYSWLAPGEGRFRDWATNIIYVIIITFIVIAVSNGTNLTDGMDGLATGTSAIVGATVAILAYLSGNAIFADYLNIMYIPNTAEIVIFMAAFVGALIGFLWYNTFPAQVFMGDTGSLAIGGIIGVAAIMIRKEFLIPIFCGIFFVESLSVLIQRYYFKYTKKKKGEGVRVFRMSPLHHHFQKENPDALIQWPYHITPEAKITVRFWIITIVLGILSVITLKIR
ncbi:MAG: phospho-N-acetylmuramoyl-pentapeptide-transferase [Bacteroidales bacterium]|nr:phospho-N-acetylmuramoyl-pentapeptide-transferase [Bacteroidales bacterium]